MKHLPRSVIGEIKEAQDGYEDKVICHVLLVVAAHAERSEPGTLAGVTQVIRAYAEKKGWKAEKKQGANESEKKNKEP